MRLKRLSDWDKFQAIVVVAVLAVIAGVIAMVVFL